MPQELATVREVHLYKLAGFCLALDQTLRRGGIKPEERLHVWQTAVSAECTDCGIRVAGEGLFGLTEPANAGRGDPKSGRMRLGDCARQGCGGYYYRLSFQNHAGVDWPGVLALVEGVMEERPPGRVARRGLRLPWRLWAESRPLRRVGFAIVIILALLVMRQWHLGGRIPLIREPERFHVDPAPEEPRGE